MKAVSHAAAAGSASATVGSGAKPEHSMDRCAMRPEGPGSA